MSESKTNNNHLLAVDSHVHLHDWLHFVPMLDSALSAFTRAVSQHKNTNVFSGILVLTEPVGRDTFPRLKTQLETSEDQCRLNSNWHLEATGEDLTIAACHVTGARIYLVSGQQIVTRENLEVLSIYTPQSINDRLNIRETIKEVEKFGGFPVLPWGVGKWLFGRGKLVSCLIEEKKKQRFGIGDNGSRPTFWQHVPQFALARKHDLPLLHGSDPLRVSEARRSAGSSGDLIICPFDSRYPGKSLVNALKENSYERISFREPEKAGHFFKDQIALRFG